MLILKKTDKYIVIGGINLQDDIVYNDNLYTIVKFDNQIYLVDFANDEKYKLENIDSYFAEPGTDLPPITFKLNNNIIEIYGYYEEESKILSYTFDPATKTLTKKKAISSFLYHLGIIPIQL